MEYILWRYVITLPLHLRQSIYGGDMYGVYTMVVHNYFAIAPTIEEIYQKYGVYTMEYVITPPLHLRQSIYGGDIYGVYTMVVHNYFAIAPTKEEI